MQSHGRALFILGSDRVAVRARALATNVQSGIVRVSTDIGV